jgi:hypothetical protein
MQADEKFLLVSKIHSLKSAIAARRQLAKQTFWGDFQMQFYVIPYEIELRALQRILDTLEQP